VFFGEKGFVDVDTAMLQVSPGNETHISAFAIELLAPSGESSTVYLHTSPEFAVKTACCRSQPSEAEDEQGPSRVTRSR
jgi:elongation factor P--beta-lysine ligase